MKGFFAAIGLMIGAALIGWMVYAGSISTLVSGDEAVVQAMGDVQSNEKRRNDLVGNLVATVEAAGIQEKGTLVEVTKARAEATKTVINVNPADLVNNPELLKKAQEAMSQMSGVFGRLLATQEAYPTLKANENYQTLMKQLEGTENRINYARERYNAAVRVNNQNVRGPWLSMFAARAGAQVRTTFEVTAEERKAPKVEFNKVKS